MLLLLRLQEQGVLNDLTLQAIGDVFDVNRSTIHRDLEDLDEVKEEYNRLMARQPWIKREYTTVEFGEEIGCSADTVRAMIRDGLVEAHKHRNRWYIPVREAERFSE